MRKGNFKLHLQEKKHASRLTNTKHFLNHKGKVTTKLRTLHVKLKGVDWIHLAQDRNRWRAVVNTAMNNQVPLNEKRRIVANHGTTASQNQLQNCTLATHFFSRSFCTTVNFCGFRRNNVLFACSRRFYTPISCDNCRKRLPWNCLPVLFNTT